MNKPVFTFSRAPQVQQQALLLAEKLLPAMSDPATAAQWLLGLVPTFLTHSAVGCRQLFCQLLQQGWSKVAEAVSEATGDTAAMSGAASSSGDVKDLSQYLQQLEACLFVLLCDRSAAVRGSAAAFWSSATSTAPATLRTGSSKASCNQPLPLLPQHPAHRLTVLLKRLASLKGLLMPLYAADSPGLASSFAAVPAGQAADRVMQQVERRWPSVAAGLLLKLPAAVGGDWTAHCFSKPLSDCHFVDYPVQTQVNARTTETHCQHTEGRLRDTRPGMQECWEAGVPGLLCMQGCCIQS
jgi:hypothetical protein